MAKSVRLYVQDVLKDYAVGKKLGTGARTEVYEVRRKSDGYLFAVKFVNVRGPEDVRAVGYMENEFRILQALHNPKTQASELVVRSEEFKKVKRQFKVKCAYLVMEKAEGRPLSDYRDYDLNSVMIIFRQTCLALEHLHGVGYVHADLKPQNIVVDDILMIKMIDFGFAAPIGQKLSAYKGTFGYLAPEQTGGKLTEKTDVFNLGAAIYWVLTGQNVPSIMPDEHEARGFVPDERVRITPPSQINPEVPQELSDMVIRCCSPKEHERPTVRELKRYLHGLQLRLDFGVVDR